MAQLVPSFAVDPDTLSGWIDDWEHEGLMGLDDKRLCCVSGGSYGVGRLCV